jgi:hypothetical protein
MAGCFNPRRKKKLSKRREKQKKKINKFLGLKLGNCFPRGNCEQINSIDSCPDDDLNSHKGGPLAPLFFSDKTKQMKSRRGEKKTNFLYFFLFLKMLCVYPKKLFG